jgi:hypothetical protein
MSNKSNVFSIPEKNTGNCRFHFSCRMPAILLQFPAKQRVIRARKVSFGFGQDREPWENAQFGCFPGSRFAVRVTFGLTFQATRI